MSEDVEHERPEQKNGTSRRAALKAGVGIGVGLVAWSGPTITSLGGTPAYAQGCTFVVRVNLSGGCRNTDQSSGCPAGQPFRYHTLVSAGLPAGYAVTNPIAEGTCCGDGLRLDAHLPGWHHLSGDGRSFPHQPRAESPAACWPRRSVRRAMGPSTSPTHASADRSRRAPRTRSSWPATRPARRSECLA